MTKKSGGGSSSGGNTSGGTSGGGNKGGGSSGDRSKTGSTTGGYKGETTRSPNAGNVPTNSGGPRSPAGGEGTKKK